MSEDECPDVLERIDHLEKQLVDLTGLAGGNGKLGAMRSEVSTLKKILLLVASFALGALGTGIVSVYRAGEADGRVNTQLEQFAERLNRLEERANARRKSHDDQE